jgi:hypothetical protein
VQRGVITAKVVVLVVRRYVAASGLDGCEYSGHSLRAGMMTSAAINNVPEDVIQRPTRHKSTELQPRCEPLRNNASGRVGP